MLEKASPQTPNFKKLLIEKASPQITNLKKSLSPWTPSRPYDYGLKADRCLQ